MDPGGSCCFCPPDKDFWEAMKNQFEDKTSVLMAKEQELRQKIEQMEVLISGRESESSYNICEKRNIPKVFPDRPEYPVRDVPKIIREKSPPRPCHPCITSPIKKEHYPSNFFQKVMENAKSILTLRCSAVHPSDPFDNKPTREKDELGDQKRDKSPNKVAFSSTVPVYTASTVCSCDEITKTDVTADSSQANTSFSCSLTCSCKNPTQSASTMTQSKKDNSSSVNSCGCGISNMTSSGPAGKNVADSVCQCCNPECGTDKDAGQNANLDSCWVNPFSCFQKKTQNAKSKKTVASSAKSCNDSTCPVKSVKSAPDVSIKGKKNQPNFADDCSKRGRSQSKNKDEDNQCALVGSPVLEKGKAGQKKNPCRCAANKSIFSIDSDDLENVKMVADLASKEKQIKCQIQGLQDREKNYENLVGNFQSVSNRTTCCCTIIQQPNGGSDFDKISQELKLENKMLKSELMEMKLELKHCLEKIEGPMKQKLETEKCKCMQLENQLNNASRNMVINHDTHSKEVNALKMQLCVACNNISELNSMNRQLKEEMDTLDCMCNKLEDDLMKQKISEAETLKRLSRRRPELEGDTRTGGAIQDSSRCDSNLHVIARKLSKTLKESEPCEECAKLPAELTGAAKCIKDLTDMVQKRKKEVDSFLDSKQDCSCQSPPATEDESCQCCKDCMNVGAGTSRATTAVDAKTTKTLFDVPPTFEKASSQFEATDSDARAAASSYYSAAGEPLAYTAEQSGGDEPCSTQPCDDKEPCADIGKPCAVEKAVQKEEGQATKEILEMGEFCTEPCTDDAPCAHGKPCFEIIPSGELKAGSVSALNKEAADAAASATKTILEGVEDAQDEEGEKEPTAEAEAAGDQEVSPAGDIAEPSSQEEAPIDVDDAKVQEEEELVSVSDIEESSAEGVPEAGEGEGTAEGEAQEGDAAEPVAIDRSAVETCRTCIEEGICQAFPQEASAEMPADAEEGALGESTTEGPGMMEAEEQELEGAPSAETPEGEIPDATALMAGTAEAYPEGVMAGVPGMASAASGLPFKEERTGTFPFEVETRADILQEPPSDLHVTTTITGSGTLEVITEGPGGVIETTLTYTADGTIEVVTQLTEDTARTVAPTVDYTSSAVSETFASEVPCVAMEAPAPCAAAAPESVMSGPTDLSGGLETGSEITRDTMMISSYISEADKTDAMAGTGKITDTGETETVAETMEEQETIIEEIAVEEAPAEEVTVEEEIAPEEVAVEEEVVAEEEITIEEVAVEEVVVEEIAAEEVPAEEAEVEVEEIAEVAEVEEEGEAAEVEVLEEEPALEPAEEEEAVEEEVAVLAPIEEGEEGEEVPVEEEAPEEEAPVEEEGAGEGASIPEEAKEEEIAEQAMTMRDCACQSSPPVEQSCQCCECKNVGVTTSQDSETLTDENMVQAPISPVETIPEEAEAETDSEFVTVTEEGTQSTQEADFAEAANLEAEKIQGTTDEVSTLKEEESNVSGESATSEGEKTSEGKAEGDAPRSSKCECDGFETAPETQDTETQEGKGETSEATTCECTTDTKGLCSTLITEENLEPCQDESVQCDCGGEVEVDDHSEGRPSSGSDTEYEIEEKESKTDEVKKSEASEVPESVSKVSDKSCELPPIGSSDSKKPRKKRSSKFDAIRCDCPGICQCVVCSPEAIAKRKALTGSSSPAPGQTGKICCCIPQPSPQFQSPVQMNQTPTSPPFQVTQAYMQSQMPVYTHPTGCQCVSCICSCTPGPQYSSAPNPQYDTVADPQYKRTSIEDVFQPSQDMPLDCQPPRIERGKHPQNCECVDCLCLPKIKKLAKIRETPIIRDEKQVYQVHTLKCACGKATGRKSSKIPIATNSPLGPPKAKASGGATCTCEKCSCSPCPDADQGKSKPEDGTPDKPGSEATSKSEGKLTNSQLADLCDCQDCQCKVCFNKPPKKGAEAADSKAPEPAKEASSNKGCCCKGACTCQPCPMDNVSKPTTPKPDGHPEDCDCDECACPRSPDRMGAGPPGASPKPDGHAEDCDCAECACPRSPSRMATGAPGTSPAAAPMSGHAEGCDCVECLCPGSPSRTGPPASQSTGPGVTPQVSFAPGHPEGCNCTECSCPGLESDSKMEKTSSTRGPQTPVGCDCDVCACPGMVTETGDKSEVPGGCDCVVCECPGRTDGGTTTSTASGPGGSAPQASVIADCDCTDCQCSPCADPKKRKPGSAAITPCDCLDCKCAPCADPAKRDGKGDAGQLGHPDGCTCAECKCAEEAEITTKITTHPANCTCAECKCPEDTGLQTEDRGVGSTENKATHPADCICDECLCGSDEKHEQGCTCPECSCVDCYHKREDKGISAEECKCGDCLCVDCPKTHKSDGKGGKAGASGGAHGANCCCIECACDVCSDETKGKSPGGDKGSGCTCTTCTCIDCAAKQKEETDTCKCGDCKCIDCPKKGAGAPSAAGASGGTAAPSGSSDGDKGNICSCGDCKCANCAYKSKKADGGKENAGASPGAPGISGSSDGDKGNICSCGDCKCANCAYKSKKADGGKENAGASPAAPGVSGSSDGDKGSCTCSTCTCVDCAGKKKSDGPPPCNCGDCKCVDCAAKKGAGGPPSAGAPSTGDNKDKGSGCTCATCICIDCKKGKTGGSTAADQGGKGAHDPTAICHCGNCKCPDCTYKKSQGAAGAGQGSKGGQPGEITLTDPPPFEVPIKEDCKCSTCQCYICSGKGGTKQPTSGAQPPQPTKSGAQGKSGEVALSTAEAPPFEVPTRLPCSCPKCDCATCNKNSVASQPASGGQPRTSAAQTCQPKSQGKAGGEVSPSTAEAPPFEVPVRSPCKCAKCDCASCNKAAPQQTSGAQPSQRAGVSVGVPTQQCDCATCTCGDEGDGKKASSKALQVNRSSVGKGEPKEQAEVIDVSRMGNAELMSKIKKDTKENCECREQIKELRRALDKIKCACTEAEIASQNKPFVKQASAFGQTMSGLKVALANLQDKCKAKDRMIEAMTDELKLRTSSNTLDKVLNTHRGSEPLDYDKAEDVKVLDRVSTNVLYPVTEEKEIGHTKVRAKSSDCRAPCKGVETDKTRKTKRKSKSHKEKDTSGVDLAGFEIVDIRRITQDSIIIKWKSPKSNLVTGYDIFVNGVNKSKVMSGGRTSAMIHSLDLSSTVQITIYAVTKEGRCEPPAIAIYEIS